MAMNEADNTVTDEDIRKDCRKWAWDIHKEAKEIFDGDVDKVRFVLLETAMALLEMGGTKVIRKC